MSGVTKLGRALLLVLAALSLLVLLAEVLYVLFLRRRLRRASASAGDPELPGGAEVGPSKELLLYLLCWKSPNRVEPVTASPQAKAAPEAEECELTRWRAAFFGPSRALYTIREEEEREGADSDAEDGTLFLTPCSSPAFFTPASSPRRSATAAAGDRV